MGQPGRVRTVTAAITAGVATLLMVGCGGVGPAPHAAPASPGSAPSVSPPSVPPPSVPPPSVSPPVVPPPGVPDVAVVGEAFGPDRARALQDAVDAGRQPWRLDPVEVAGAFVGGLPGWEGARVVPTGPATVEVTAPGRRDAMLLRLGQPATEGPTGVWVVQGGSRRS